MSWRIRVEHHSRYQYAGVVALVLQRGPDHALTTPDTAGARRPGRGQPGRPAAAATWTTGARSSTPSTCTSPTASCESSAARWSRRPCRRRPAVDSSGWADLHGEPVARRLRRAAGPDRLRSRSIPACPRWRAELQAPTTPADAGQAAVDWVRDQLTYVAGTTGVHTSAVEAWEGGQGVCQDFAHLALALVRAMGIPGPLLLGLPAPQPRRRHRCRRVEGESHAWIEVWTGDWQASTRPSAGRSANATSSSPGAATTPTSPRSKASSTAGPPPASTSRSA